MAIATFKLVTPVGALGLVKKPRELKWTEETIVQKLEQVIQTLGYFPSVTDLDSMGLAGLCSAIGRFGGQQKFWKVMCILGDDTYGHFLYLFKIIRLYLSTTSRTKEANFSALSGTAIALAFSAILANSVGDCNKFNT